MKYHCVRAKDETTQRETHEDLLVPQTRPCFLPTVLTHPALWTDANQQSSVSSLQDEATKEMGVWDLGGSGFGVEVIGK
uniref:Uncharacterized protein n=1 Tax=Knipowitschia caucasica TaxID=637954 RepID=A0AAV2JWN0_KNICA